MKPLVLGATVLAVAAATGAAWNVLRNTTTQKPAPAHPTQVQQVSLDAPKRFDLSNLPRALELPLVETPLQPGDIAPDFELPDQTGQLHRLSTLRGQTVVLSFYPRDLTYSCVGEVVSFDRNLPAFYMRATNVFSVSVQNVASKSVFAARYDISYPLLADTSKTTARNYRVLSKDDVAGRVTFVIGPDGRIQWTDQKVHAQTHATDVLNFLDSRPKTGIAPAAPSALQQQTAQRFAVNSLPPHF